MANGLTHRTKPPAPRKIRGFGSGMEEENADKCKGHWLGVEGQGLETPSPVVLWAVLLPDSHTAR